MLSRVATSSTGVGYRYGFNGKEDDFGAKGSLAPSSQDQLDYGNRIYDPRVGRFLSVDPLAKKYPWNSTYAFAENDVVRSTDLDGREKFDVVTTSFAPFDIFGKDFFGGYFGDGDNRKFGGAPFSISGDIGKYRIMGAVRFDMETMNRILLTTVGATTSTYHRKSWNPLSDYTATSPTHLEFESNSTNSSSLAFKFHTYGSDQAVLGASIPFAPVPNIDNHVDVKITKINATKFSISGAVAGDRYPSNETYLRDEKGGILMLGVSGANRGQGGPYLSLWGDAKKAMSSFSFDILLNDDNSFKGVQLKDKFFTLAEWNKQFSDISPKEAKGTKTDNAGVIIQSF